MTVALRRPLYLHALQHFHCHTLPATRCANPLLPWRQGSCGGGRLLVSGLTRRGARGGASRQHAQRVSCFHHSGCSARLVCMEGSKNEMCEPTVPFRCKGGSATPRHVLSFRNRGYGILVGERVVLQRGVRPFYSRSTASVSVGMLFPAASFPLVGTCPEPSSFLGHVAYSRARNQQHINITHKHSKEPAAHDAPATMKRNLLVLSDLEGG